MRYDLINEDSNQFGPGTDLIICLLALLMVFVVIVSYLYGNEKKINTRTVAAIGNCKGAVGALGTELEDCRKKIENLKNRGEFKPAGEFLVAGTFKQNPYYELQDPQMTENEVQSIMEKYDSLSAEYPFIFVIGHANVVGLAGKPNLTYEERLKYNWEFAGVRSAVIANLIQKHLSEEEKNKIIIVSTGEFDLKISEDPESSENAFVEVFFGNEWKPQAYKKASP
jgi:hypothetical protein